MLPTASSLVVLMPMETTVPRKSPTVIISPTLNSFSNTINRPATTSPIRLCIPRPTTRVMTPAPVISAVVSIPHTASTAITIITVTTHLIILLISLTMVISRWDLLNALFIIPSTIAVITSIIVTICTARTILGTSASKPFRNSELETPLLKTLSAAKIQSWNTYEHTTAAAIIMRIIILTGPMLLTLFFTSSLFFLKFSFI